MRCIDSKNKKTRNGKPAQAGFSITRGAPALYPAPEIEDEVLSFYFPSKSDAGFLGSLGTSGSQAFFQTHVFGV